MKFFTSQEYNGCVNLHAKLETNQQKEEAKLLKDRLGSGVENSFGGNLFFTLKNINSKDEGDKLQSYLNNLIANKP